MIGCEESVTLDRESYRTINQLFSIITKEYHLEITFIMLSASKLFFRVKDVSTLKQRARRKCITNNNSGRAQCF